MIKRTFRQFGRQRPNELTAAFLALAPGELARGITELFADGELRLVPRKRKARKLCPKFYQYHKANPEVAGWFLQAAQSLRKKQNRKRYGIGALTEQIRWDVQQGIIKTDHFRISNDIRACYARLVLMRDPSLCGLFAIKPSIADASLVIDSRPWSDFAREYHALLWPAHQPATKKPSASVRPVSGERYGS
jgi:hypothetical protein